MYFYVYFYWLQYHNFTSNKKKKSLKTNKSALFISITTEDHWTEVQCFKFKQIIKNKKNQGQKSSMLQILLANIHSTRPQNLKHWSMFRRKFMLTDKKNKRLKTKSHYLLRSKKPQNSIQHPSTVQWCVTSSFF